MGGYTKGSVLLSYNMYALDLRKEHDLGHDYARTFILCYTPIYMYIYVYMHIHKNDYAIDLFIFYHHVHLAGRGEGARFIGKRW